MLFYLLFLFIKGAYSIFLEVGEGRRETLSLVPLKDTFRRRFVPFLSKERSESMWIIDIQNKVCADQSLFSYYLFVRIRILELKQQKVSSYVVCTYTVQPRFSDIKLVTNCDLVTIFQRPFFNLLQSNLAIRNGLISNKLVSRNYFLWPICHSLHKDKQSGCREVVRNEYFVGIIPVFQLFQKK